VSNILFEDIYSLINADFFYSDYAQGPLSTALYILPLLKQNNKSFALANCLRNSSSWKSHDHFIADYMGIPNDDTLNQLMRMVKGGEGDSPDEIPGMGLGLMPMLGDKFYCWDLTRAKETDYADSIPRSYFYQLLGRGQFMKWLYTVFWRINLPFRTDLLKVDFVIISPLNITNFFRLLTHMSLIGYPSHWLSECLLNILEDRVFTSARPPRRTPVAIEDITRVFPLKKLSVAPFVAEMATLTAVFDPLLPFSLPTNLYPFIPPISDVLSYSFHLKDYERVQYFAGTNCLLLVFWNQQMKKDTFDEDLVWKDLRLILDPSWGDEVDINFKGKAFEAFRNKGVLVWSAFNWDLESKTATVWMSKTIASSIIENDWAVGMFRSDNWTCLTNHMSPPLARNVVTVGNKWEDC
jgi:hypothetical protein